jgi:hypothetical protein
MCQEAARSNGMAGKCADRPRAATYLGKQYLGWEPDRNRDRRAQHGALFRVHLGHVGGTVSGSPNGRPQLPVRYWAALTIGGLLFLALVIAAIMSR